MEDNRIMQRVVRDTLVARSRPYIRLLKIFKKKLYLPVRFKSDPTKVLIYLHGYETSTLKKRNGRAETYGI